MNIDLIFNKLRNNAPFNRKTSFLVDILFFDWLALPATRLIAKVKWITPNSITIVSGLFGISAAYMYFEQQILEGCILMYISMLLDCMDGNLARLTQRVSPIGAKLDSAMDSVKKILSLGALWYISDWNRFILIGMIIAHYLLIRFFQPIYNSKRKRELEILHLEPFPEPYDLMVILLLFGPLVGFEYTLSMVLCLQITIAILMRGNLRQPNSPPFTKN